MALEALSDEENIEADTAQSPKVFNALNIKMLQPKSIGFARPFMPDLPPEGSTIAPAFRRRTMLGNYINSVDPKDFDQPELMTPDYNYVDHIPPKYFDKYGHLYATTLNPAHAEAVTAQVDAEESDNQIMNNAPWRSFLSTMLVNLVDPSIILPGGTIYRNSKAAANVGRSAFSVGVASAAAATAQEIVAQQTQLTKEMSESVYDVIGAGLVGSVIGGLGGAYTGRAIFNKAKKELIETIADEAPIGPKMTVDQSLSAAKVRDPEYQKELNSLYGGTVTAAAGKFLGYVTQKLTPQGRLLFSPFGTARAIANELPEHNLIINANIPGKRKVMGPDGKEIEVERGALEKPIAVESEIKELKRGMYKKLMDYQEIFYEQAGISGPFKNIKAKLSTAEGLNFGDFEKAVWRSVVTGEKHPNAGVNKASDLIINDFFEPVKNEYIALGIFPEDISVNTAANYFMRVYNRDKIRDPVQRAKTKAKFEAFIKNNNEELIALKPEIERLEMTIKQYEAKAGKAKGSKTIEKLREELKNMIPARLYNSKGELRQIIDPDYYGVEADKIIDNILGMGQDDAFNPIMATLPSKKTNPLKHRQFLIPDIEIEDELITAFSEVAPMFINATAPNIGLLRYAKRLGLETDNEGRGVKLAQLEEDYKLEVAKNPQNEEKLYKRFQKDKKDILALFDILKGVYGMGPNVLDSSASRVIKNVSLWNYTRFMGQITLQAFTDLGAIGMKHGLFRTIHDGFIPVIKELASGGYDKDFLKDLGFIAHTYHGSRMKAMMDQDPTAGQKGLFSRAAETFADTYGNLTLMNQWTDMMEFIAGKASMARTLRAIDEWATTGKMSDKEANRLNELGLNAQDFKVIHEQYKKHGGKTQGSHWVNWGKWDSDNSALDALRKFRQTTIKEVDQTVISGPGIGEKPLYTRKGIGSLIFQFKGFSYAMTNKVLISGLQRGDAETFQGLVMMGALGLISYVATSLARGEEELDLSYDTLFKEMIDRSGITGVFGNFYNTANKLGLIPGKEVTRYRNRGLAATFGGPTVGAIEDTLALAAKALNQDTNMTTNDMYKLLRMFPTQNYLFTHRLNKMVAKDFADYLGFEESPE